jgi:GNAT superfamily N-acetyltransferase
MKREAGLAIRAARAAELPRLLEIERAAASLFEQVGLADLFANILTPEGDLEEGLATGRLWVATLSGGEPVGFALARLVGANAHLDELDVLPEYGRRGIGSALVETFLCWAESSGLRGATLTTLHDVPWNAPFYERFGFRVLGAGELSPALCELLRHEIERGLPAENRVAMYRPLRLPAGEP